MFVNITVSENLNLADLQNDVTVQQNLTENKLLS